MFQSDKKTNSIGSILDAEIIINGDLDVKKNLIVQGTVNGNINSTQTLNTAKGSKIKGNIIAKNAMISGEIHGDVEVKEKIKDLNNDNEIIDVKIESNDRVIGILDERKSELLDESIQIKKEILHSEFI